MTKTEIQSVADRFAELIEMIVLALEAHLEASLLPNRVAAPMLSLVRRGLHRLASGFAALTANLAAGSQVPGPQRAPRAAPQPKLPAAKTAWTHRLGRWLAGPWLAGPWLAGPWLAGPWLAKSPGALPRRSPPKARSRPARWPSQGTVTRDDRAPAQSTDALTPFLPAVEPAPVPPRPAPTRATSVHRPPSTLLPVLAHPTQQSLQKKRAPTSLSSLADFVTI